MGALVVRQLYVAGPMTGLPDFNRPAFDDAARRLRAAGISVYNPADISRDVEGLGDRIESRSREWYLRRALLLLLECDGVALLPGWETSGGARLEQRVALGLGMRAESVEWWLEEASRG